MFVIRSLVNPVSQVSELDAGQFDVQIDADRNTSAEQSHRTHVAIDIHDAKSFREQERSHDVSIQGRQRCVYMFRGSFMS